MILRLSRHVSNVSVSQAAEGLRQAQSRQADSIAAVEALERRLEDALSLLPVADAVIAGAAGNISMLALLPFVAGAVCFCTAILLTCMLLAGKDVYCHCSGQLLMQTLTKVLWS